MFLVASVETPPPFHFRQRGRSKRLGLAIFFWLGMLAVFGLLFQAALWIVILLALPLLPAGWDLWRNPKSGLSIGDTTFSWFTADRHDEISLQDIALLRLDRRLDLSFRATLITKAGQKIRLPQASLPAVDLLEQAFQQRSIPSARHHFTVL